MDVNQTALFGDADAGTAHTLARHVAARDVPCLLGVSSTVAADVGDVLRANGWEPTGIPEAMFFAARLPPIAESAFEVRRVRGEADHAAVQRLFAEAHGYAPEFTAGMYGPSLLDRPDVGGWVAWDGPEPVSCVFVTRVDDSLGVFDMMTTPRHRRRGAGRSVLTRALADAAAWGEAVDAIAFWSTPLGRPLYESLGFALVDDIAPWTLGASAEDLAAVGVG